MINISSDKKGFEIIDNSSKLLRINCQNNINVEILISLDMESIISISNCEINKSDSKFPKIFFCCICYVASKRSFKKALGSTPWFIIALRDSMDFF